MIVISASVVKCRRNLFKETRMPLHRRTTDEICRSQVSDWSRVTPSSLIVFEDWKVLSENVKVKSEVFFCRDCLVPRRMKSFLDAFIFKELSLNQLCTAAIDSWRRILSCDRLSLSGRELSRSCVSSA